MIPNLFFKHTHTHRYFTSFMNLIHSLNRVEWSKLTTLHKQPLLRHVASLQEATICAMSNMLTANIDSGLTQAISEYSVILGNTKNSHQK